MIGKLFNVHGGWRSPPGGRSSYPVYGLVLVVGEQKDNFGWYVCLFNDGIGYMNDIDLTFSAKILAQ